MPEKHSDPRVRDLDELLRGSYVSDVTVARQLLAAEDSQYNRRAYVRSVFAYIEGMTWQMKMVVLKIHQSGLYDLRFTPGEVAILSEEAYDLDQDGEPVQRRKELRFLENARFALTRYVRVFWRQGHPEARPDFGGMGWAAFREAVKVRNRLTHPKNLKEGRVSDTDLQVVRRAVEWWEGTQKELIGRLAGRPIGEGDAS